MNPQDTAERLIHDWPTLYGNRQQAIEGMLSQSMSRWENGELVTDHDSHGIQYIDEELAEGIDDAYGHHMKLRRRNTARFNRENANLIARDTVSKYNYGEGSDHPSANWGQYYGYPLVKMLEEMPDDVTEEWAWECRKLAEHLWFSTGPFRGPSIRYGSRTRVAQSTRQMAERQRLHREPLLRAGAENPGLSDAAPHQRDHG